LGTEMSLLHKTVEWLLPYVYQHNLDFVC
jgi:hypothetical protein